MAILFLSIPISFTITSKLRDDLSIFQSLLIGMATGIFVHAALMAILGLLKILFPKITYHIGRRKIHNPKIFAAKNFLVVTVFLGLMLAVIGNLLTDHIKKILGW